ncbi:MULTISPECIES: competence type IV pilus major pilin ComGC [unclassified Thomasclavelia]|uniref:Prepilin-type N-terminal cleavage/methylation domain-containing protein n=1 Tax=Candidatus Erysipelatoclostridium merdavium TaxID=2838566 RepID=A0A9D2BLN7_9FIRM|nr:MULTISPECIES: competence type IV pilus major pilin ComGC [unclassified Thomasclavelia]OUP79050.1 competence protein ComGC [Erysipelatoclostridium sp. An173]OUQ09326.1 competence protein ComGC [Erysipelatoclostridium sp. An15]WRK54895.1 competence type IV pilus major pilin ComGC [Coprobacillaceae bacterium CR2/5/TPMF4]HIX80696.1 prepilin-type N-terminal cleavage/methylation domain-containing protein [Candidatus Erysipelatoclostridium merdavium]
MKKMQKGFTLIELIFCISIILVILLLVIPNVTSKNRVVKEKSCDAQIEVVNSQIILYEIEHGRLPTSISDLTSGDHPYLTQKQATCPSGLSIYISDGQAYAR